MPPSRLNWSHVCAAPHNLYSLEIPPGGPPAPWTRDTRRHHRPPPAFAASPPPPPPPAGAASPLSQVSPLLRAPPTYPRGARRACVPPLHIQPRPPHTRPGPWQRPRPNLHPVTLRATSSPILRTGPSVTQAPAPPPTARAASQSLPPNCPHSPSPAHPRADARLAGVGGKLPSDHHPRGVSQPGTAHAAAPDSPPFTGPLRRPLDGALAPLLGRSPRARVSNVICKLCASSAQALRKVCARSAQALRVRQGGGGCGASQAPACGCVQRRAGADGAGRAQQPDGPRFGAGACREGGARCGMPVTGRAARGAVGSTASARVRSAAGPGAPPGARQRVFGDGCGAAAAGAGWQAAPRALQLARAGCAGSCAGAVCACRQLAAGAGRRAGRRRPGERGHCFVGRGDGVTADSLLASAGFVRVAGSRRGQGRARRQRRSVRPGSGPAAGQHARGCPNPPAR